MFGQDNNRMGVLMNPGDPNGLTDPGDQADKLVVLEEGGYYGHCNIARARAGDDRQWYCYLPADRNANFTAPVSLLPSSADGVACYRSETFNGGAKEDLFV